MQIRFHKYQGTGNDFVMIDDREETFPANDSKVIGFLCDRKMGVGADGVILIQNHPTEDFRMIYFNPDGSKSLCGNGSRCAIAFAQSLGIIDQKTTFETTDGIHDAFIEGDIYHFHLHDVGQVEQISDTDLFINTGSPHHIQLVDQVDQVDLLQVGRSIRYSDKYAPGGTNVNFVEKKEHGIKVRTYERGVENETLSCGTGVTACALAAEQLAYKSPITVETKGGILMVSFEKDESNRYKNIYLAGPAKKVFEGVVEVPR
ncbi:diaminopimelate epimerase [Marinoscillum sp.]|uniref:diaminopimelate epimerase n=1 Tax=Marinoscillum sp. TaxID=2024838 RepID=UPI003BAADEEE